MARFDVYEFKNPQFPLIVDVQAGILADFDVHVVLPLSPLSQKKYEIFPRLKPVLSIRNTDYILVTTDIASIRTDFFGAFVENIENRYRQDITAALDFLFQGF